MALWIRIILSIVVSALIMTGVIIKVTRFPRYETEAVIMVDMKKSPTSVDSERMDAKELMAHIRAHSELLESDPILRPVVEELKLYEDIPEWRELQAQGIVPDEALKRKIMQETVSQVRNMNAETHREMNREAGEGKGSMAQERHEGMHGTDRGDMGHGGGAGGAGMAHGKGK